MTALELNKLNVETEYGIFTPIYTYEDIILNEETKEREYVGLIITKTAEEVYKEWLENKDKPVVKEPTEIEVLQQENVALKEQVSTLTATINFHEDLIAEMAMMIYA